MKRALNIQRGPVRAERNGRKGIRHGGVVMGLIYQYECRACGDIAEAKVFGAQLPRYCSEACAAAAPRRRATSIQVEWRVEVLPVPAALRTPRPAAAVGA